MEPAEEKKKGDERIRERNEERKIHFQLGSELLSKLISADLFRV